MNSPIILSIVVVNYNTRELTLECLRSIYNFPPECPFEIILIENGEDLSDDIQDFFPEVKFIKNSDNKGYASANNLAVCNANGEFIVLLNSDTRLIEPAFDAMVEYMQVHPKIGALGPRQIDGDGRFQLSFGHFPNLFSELIRKVLHYRLSINDCRVRDYLDEKHSGISTVDWVSGSCLMLRRRALAEVGLLDERFFMYFEDIDLCQRIRNKQWLIHYFPRTTIIHYGGKSAQLNLMHVLTEYRKSQIYFTRKYYGMLGEMAIRFLLLMKFFYYFSCWGLIFLVQKILIQNTLLAYTKSLLAKKILGIVFTPLSFEPHEPSLIKPPASQREEKILNPETVAEILPHAGALK